MDFFDAFLLGILGDTGVILFVGIIFFMLTYKNSQLIFQKIEDKTFGTRDYIREKCELLHWRVKDEHITYVLIFLFFGLPSLIFSLMMIVSSIHFAIFISIVFVVIGVKVPRPFMDFLVNKRIKQYETQMIDALNLLTNGIRAGLSVPQAIGMVVDEMPAPVSEEFNLVLQQNKIGSPLEECLDELSVRMPTEDNLMFVSSVNILRETGGNLAETFDTIVGIIRERIRLKQKIDTYVAQGMMQAMVMFSMPYAMVLITISSDPDAMIRVFTGIYGIILMIFVTILDFIGLFIILKIVRIKV